MRYVSLLFFLVLSGCGLKVPELEGQIIESGLVKPPWPVAEQDAFQLTGLGDRLDMKGSILIWDENVTADNISYLSAVSRKKKQQSVNYERISQRVARERQELDKSLPIIAAQEKRLQQLINSSRKRAREADPAAWKKQESQRWEKTTAMLTIELAELATIDSSWNQEHTNNVLRRYCTGKIFAFAVSENLLRRKFSKRPTPHVVCEDYYGTIFSNQPACQDAEDANGKDYFQCIWQHGVLASDYFTTAYEVVAKQQDKIAELKRVVADEPAKLKRLVLDSYDNPAKRRYLKFYQRLGRIGFGDRTLAVRPQKGQAFILKLVQDVESTAQLEDDGRVVAAHKIFLNAPANAEIATQRKEIIVKLQAIARTVGGISVSDYKFNREIAIPRIDEVGNGACVEDGLASRKMELICNLRKAEELLPALKEVAIAFLPADQELIAAATAALSQLKQGYDAAIANLTKLDMEAFDTYSKTLDKAVNAARGEGLAQALFAQAQLQIVNSADISTVNFKLLEKSPKWYVSCFARDSGEETACGGLRADQIQDPDVFSASYVKEEGRLDLHLNLRDPQLWGFAYLSRDSDTRSEDRASFCDIVAEKFQGLQLQMKLYANRFAQALEIITGNGEFKNAHGATVFTASVGFGREIDLN